MKTDKSTEDSGKKNYETEQEGTVGLPGGNRGRKARKGAQLCLYHPPTSVGGGLWLPQV